MTAKERKLEAREMEQAVMVLFRAVRSVARRKAYDYERELLRRVRDRIDVEIESMEEARGYCADLVSNEVKQEIIGNDESKD